MRRWLLAATFCLVASFPAFAQLGYGIPQTIQIRALNGVTAPTTFVIPNVGQSIHYLQYSVSGGNTCAQLFLGLEGSNDGTSFFQISEIATDSPTGGVYASGYFPVVRVNLFAIGICGGGTLSAFYSATSSGFGTPLGIFGQSGGLRKVIAQLQPVNSPPTVKIGVPLGSSQGRIYLSCFTAAGVSNACPSGGSLTVSAIPSSEMPAIQILSNAIGTVSTTQIFDVPATATNNVSITWSGFAVSALTLTAYYQFSPPGSIASGVMMLTTGQAPPSLIGTSGAFVSYSPAQLGMNAITLPASAATALSITIDFRGAKQAVFTGSCTQTVNFQVQTFMEDGTTIAVPSTTLTSTGFSANTVNQVSFGSESSPTAWPAAVIAAANNVRLPQRAMAFGFFNAGAVAGTCTARLFLAY